MYNVSALEDGERGETDLVKLHIETGDASLIAQQIQRVPFAVRRELARQLHKMQRNNVIQPSHSPWANVTQVHQFLGLTSYYRRFIKGIAEVASPLHSLTKMQIWYMEWRTPACI